MFKIAEKSKKRKKIKTDCCNLVYMWGIKK